MKNQLRNPRKLAVRKETVRTLDAIELSGAVGGQVTSTVLPTHICASVRMACLTTPV